MQNLLILLIVSGFSSFISASESPQTPDYSCNYTSQQISIDGVLEASWLIASWSDYLAGINVSEEFETRVKMLWDNDYLYITAVLEENSAWEAMQLNDAYIPENNFDVVLKSTKSSSRVDIRAQALGSVADIYLVEINPSGRNTIQLAEATGIKYGIQIIEPQGIDENERWVVEIAIPLNKVRSYLVHDDSEESWKCEVSFLRSSFNGMSADKINHSIDQHQNLLWQEIYLKGNNLTANEIENFDQKKILSEKQDLTQ